MKNEVLVSFPCVGHTEMCEDPHNVGHHPYEKDREENLSISEFLGAENIGRLREIETGPYGGDGGEWFTDWWESLDGTDYEPKHPPQQINIRAGGRVDQITMFYGGWRGRPHGGEGGALHRLRLYEGDRIIRVAGRRGIGPGAGIDQITLYTLK